MNILLKKRFEIFSFRPYLLYFIGHTASMVGTGMQFIGSSWLVMELTGKGHSVAFVLISASLPGVFLSPFIGLFVDRIDRKKLTVLMDLVRALFLLLIPVLWWAKILHPWHLYLVTFLVALGDEVYTPSAMALIREVIPKEMLLNANSTTTISQQIGALAGAGFAGVVIVFFSPVAVMVVNAASFIFSALCLLNMRRGTVLPGGSNKTEKDFKVLINEMKVGINYIKNNQSIILYYLMMMYIRATLYTINVLLAPFSKNILKVGAMGFGYIDASFAIGAIIGNILLPEMTRRFGSSKIMTLGIWGIAFSLIGFSFSNDILTAVLIYFLIGLTFQVGVLFLTKAQESTPLEFQGRVHMTFNTFFAISSMAIYMLMGYLGEVLSIRWLYGFQGTMLIIAGIISYKGIYLKSKAIRAKAEEERQYVRT